MTLASIAAHDRLAAFAIARTLPLEGGFVDDPADPGGATNRGVSLRFALSEIGADPSLIGMFDLDHNGRVDRGDISNLTADQAADIYYRCDWQHAWYGKLEPDLVAWKCFDISVNTGPKRAALTLQKALATAGDYIFPDASVGPLTIAAVERQYVKDGGHGLLQALRAEQAHFYSRLVAKTPEFRRFLDGWMKRAAA